MPSKHALESVPFVEIKGTRFYSDRFYLNHTMYDDDDADAVVRRNSKQDACHCGAKQPPPLFNRLALVASLDLKAAIIGSFSIDPNTLQKEFPKLFGANATIPTLVLHGRKGWTASKSPPEKPGDDPESGSFPSSIQSIGADLDENDDDCTIHTQDNETIQAARIYAATLPQSPAEATPQNGSVAGTRHRTHMFSPETVHWTEITASWVRPANLPKSTCGLVDENGAVSLDVVDWRESRRGVHHPKFMILLETSGSVIVVVSTANFTESHTTDATWLQRFPAKTGNTTDGTTTAANQTNDDCCSAESDFGATLSNFLMCQMLSTRQGQLTTLAFMNRYLGWKSLRVLERSFCFNKAQVHLIATVPGDHGGRHGRPRQRFFYGRQRVADVLHQLSRSAKNESSPRLPSAMFSDHDRLFIQPTSFGADWTSRTMSHVVRSYLGHDDDEESTDASRGPWDVQYLKRLDIVWPTQQFVQDAKRFLVGRGSPDSVAHSCGASVDTLQIKDEEVAENESGGYLFLSSESFNRISLDCLSQMVMFETSVPPQRETTLVPHFKSIARLFKGSDYRLRKDFSFGRSEAYFSWFLLTSACLSLGAQGEECDNPAPGTDYVSYSNFELGVLFSSRLQKDQSRDRVYCWKPSQCSCTANSGGLAKRLIHLPIPFGLSPSRYQEDEEEADFCETPYFHELLPGTTGVGHMRLTPYGAAVAAQQKE
jgi:hypothetical protein